MVGIVIVSHSRSLAESLIDLVKQVSNVEIPITFAAGVGPDRSEFGTDAVEIMEAIHSVYSDDGVLVLMDLGSAILSAEMAVDLLDPEVVEKVRFCAAPIVEGAIAAGVQSGLGANLEDVCQEASSALLPKIEHITGLKEGLPEGVSAETHPIKELYPSDDGKQIILTLRNLHGLHARPAARFVQTAGKFDAQLYVKDLTNGKGPVSAKSLNALATLGAVKDHRILISASGFQAVEALQALENLIEINFGEPDDGKVKRQPLEKPEELTEKISGDKSIFEAAVPVSEGYAIGPFYHYWPTVPEISQDPGKDPDFEWNRLEKALVSTKEGIVKRRNELMNVIGEAEAEIFEAHLLILQDPDLLAEVKTLIYSQRKNAAAALHDVIQKTAQSYRELENEYLQQRAMDVIDVGNQVQLVLAGKEANLKIKLETPVVLYARELTPTETSLLDMSLVLGILTAGGGPTSHSAILARSLGIPAISGVDITFERLPDHTLVALDGFTGKVWIDPDKELISEFEGKRNNWLDQRKELLAVSVLPASTKDGKRVEVVANVGNVLDAKSAVQSGAEGIGLLRTEFLFLTRNSPPSEDEQFDVLLQIGATMVVGGASGPIIVRTLDVGGDKDLPYIDLPPEDNPFLGVRAIRLSLRNPDVFKVQLKAILRAARDYPFKIMFPMITNPEEVIQARTILNEAHHSLEVENVDHKWPIDVGIMIEVPAAALLSPELARHVDFFSIGTNDLTQYTLAAERGNPALSQFNDALHPAVLRLIKSVVDGAHQYGRWVGVCGELAGDPPGALLLVGLGVDELSMNPSAIPRVKALLRSINIPDVKDLVEQVLKLDSAKEVRDKSNRFVESLG